jgi:hypothetical protein
MVQNFCSLRLAAIKVHAMHQVAPAVHLLYTAHFKGHVRNLRYGSGQLRMCSVGLLCWSPSWYHSSRWCQRLALP